MPWSDWQPRPQVRTEGQRLRLIYNSTTGYDGRVENMSFSEAARVEGESPAEQWSGIQFGVSPHWNDLLPSIIDVERPDLVRFVDYEPIPDDVAGGRGPFDFVQYESGVTVTGAWEFTPMSVFLNDDKTGHMWVVSPTNYTTTAYPDPLPHTPAYQGISAADAPGTPVLAPDPVPEVPFTIGTYASAGLYEGGALVVDLGRPVTVATLPRWRYWKPDTGILPLRQFPRDDGLRGGPPRASGPSSRQGSTRLTAYI